VPRRTLLLAVVLFALSACGGSRPPAPVSHGCPLPPHRCIPTDAELRRELQGTMAREPGAAWDDPVEMTMFLWGKSAPT
jgi:hypothetical protein